VRRLQLVEKKITRTTAIAKSSVAIAERYIEPIIPPASRR
jgi:hypothetical protein